MDDAIELRALGLDDVAACVALAHTVGWSTREDGWRWMISLADPVGAVSEGRLVGTALVMPYGDQLRMIAMMMVDARLQRRGIGRALLHRAVDGMPGVTSLFASPAGLKLYRPFGFAEAGATVRFEGAPGVGEAREPRGRLRPLSSNDLERAIALDAAAQGAPRERLVGSLMGLRELAWGVESSAGELSAFGIAYPDPDGTRRLGPIVADHDDDAIAIADHLAGGAARVRLDLEPGEVVMREWAVGRALAQGEVSPRLTFGGPIPGARASSRTLAGRPFG